jgi:hypothetical protein
MIGLSGSSNAYPCVTHSLIDDAGRAGASAGYRFRFVVYLERSYSACVVYSRG